ncbi:MAG: VOC family protein [Pseudomonadota bacterium]
MLPRNSQRLRFGLLALAALATACTTHEAAEPFWPESPPDITSALYSRAGITVANMDESLTLYRDIFGMKVVVDRQGKTDPRLSAFSGLLDDQAIRLVILRTETDSAAQLNAGYIGLAQIIDPEGTSRAAHPPLQSSGAEPGAVMLMFVVEDVRAVERQVRTLGYHIISPSEQRADGSRSELLIRGPNNERLWVTDRYPRKVLVEKTVR